MDYGKNKNLTDNNLSTEFEQNDEKTSNFIEQFSRTLLEERNHKSDLKLKISKLEAYSRQLCMHLIDLQKNREDITNKTLALSAELERTENEAEAIYSEPNVDFFLPVKKSGCCSICMGDIEKDSNNEWDDEEASDLPEPLNISSLQEINAPQCCCCMYCQNHGSYDYLSEKSHNSESNSGSNSTSCIFSNYESFQHARKMSRGDSNFCCVCTNFEEPSIGHCYKICQCNQQIVDGAEERFRGGVDCLATPQQFININNGCLEEYEATKRLNKICESCGTHNIQDSLSASPSRSSKCKVIENSEKNSPKIEEISENLSTKFPAKEKSKIEQSEETEDVTKVSINTGNSRSRNEIFDNDIEDNSKMKINASNLSIHSQYLETMNNELLTEEKKSGQKQSIKSDLATGLFVLFIIIFSYASRYSDLSLLIIYLNHLVTYLYEIFDISKNEKIAKLIDIFNREFTNIRKLFHFLTNHFTFLGAVFGSISFVRSVWSVFKNVYFFLRKDSYDYYPYFSLRKCCKLFKSSFKHFIVSYKSQVHFFSYVSWLALGFLIGKLSRISDNWYLQSPRTVTDNYLTDGKRR